MMKLCSVCNIDKSIEYFYKGRRQCIPCVSSKKSKWYADTADTRRATHKSWRDNSKNHLVSKRKREWNDIKSDPDKLKSHREKVRHHSRAYAKTEKGKIIRLQNTNARRARTVGSTGFYDWIACLEIYNQECALCGVKGNLTADHIQPLSKGGSNWQFNIQPLCKSCNSSKGNKVNVYQQYK